MSDAASEGERPDPNERPCDNCGHIWFAGERRHEYVDEDEVLCILCRRKREWVRAQA
jgi:hypothetical protein